MFSLVKPHHFFFHLIVLLIKAPSQPRIEREAVQLVNKSLAKEAVHLQEACSIQMAELCKDEKIQTLEQYKPHNVHRRMKRKDTKIAQQKECITQQAKELKQRDQQAAKSAREQIRYYKQKCAQVQEHMESECEDCKDLEEQLLN